MTGSAQTLALDAGADHWVDRFFADADLVQIERLAAWFADDIDLRFANNPPIADKATAVAVMSHFYETIAGMRHEATASVVQGDTVAQQAIVTYHTKDGRTVPLPVSSYLRRNTSGLVDRLWIYIDMAPMSAPLVAI